MAIPVFGSIGALYGNTSAAPAPAVPASVAAGDFIVIYMFVDDTATITGLPAGFVHATGSPISVAAGAGFGEHYFVKVWKRATGADAGTYAFTLSASVFAFAQAVRYTSVVASGNPFDEEVWTRIGPPPSATVPGLSVTSLGPDRLLIYGASNHNGDAGTWSAPSTFTQRSSGGAGVTNIEVSDKALAVAGGSGTVAATHTQSGYWGAFLSALIGTTAGGGGITATDAPGGMRWGSTQETVTIGVTVADSPQGMSMRSPAVETVAIGVTVADTPVGIAQRSADGPGVAVNPGAQDSPRGYRWGSATETVAFGVTTADAPAGHRMGTPSATAGSAIVTADNIGGFRWGSIGGTVTIGVTAADSPAGLRAGSGIEVVAYGLTMADAPGGLRLGTPSATANNATIVSDAPGGLRWGSAPEALVYSTIAADAPGGLRWGVASEVVAAGVVVADVPGGHRLGSAGGTITVGPGGVFDTPQGFRWGSGLSVVQGAVAPPIDIYAVVRRMRATADVRKMKASVAVGAQPVETVVSAFRATVTIGVPQQ